MFRSWCPGSSHHRNPFAPPRAQAGAGTGEDWLGPWATSSVRAALTLRSPARTSSKDRGGAASGPSMAPRQPGLATVATAWPGHHSRHTALSFRSGTQTLTRRPEQTTATPAVGGEPGDADANRAQVLTPHTRGASTPLLALYIPGQPKSEPAPHEPTTCPLRATPPSVWFGPGRREEAGGAGPR
jgi:hypothetical protein